MLKYAAQLKKTLVVAFNLVTVLVSYAHLL